MAPSFSKNGTAALGLAAALLTANEAFRLPPAPHCVRSDNFHTLDPFPKEQLTPEIREVQRYIADASAKLPEAAALKSLVQIGSPAIPTLATLASDSGASLSLRTGAIRAIGEIGGPESIAPLSRALSAARFDPLAGPIFRATVEAISFSGEPEGIRLLVDIAQGPHRSILESLSIDKLSVTWALGRFKSREAFDALWSVASNPNISDEVRDTAFSCIRRFGDFHGISQERLVNLLENPGELSRPDLFAQAAQFGLSEFTPELVSVALSQSCSVAERRSALQGLRALKASQECDKLATLVASDESSIAAGAMRLLISTGEPSHVSAVITQLRNNPDKLSLFPRQEYVSRASEDIDFLCATHAMLGPVIQHAIFQSEHPHVSIIEAADLSPLFAVAISGLAQRVLTQETTLAAQLDSPLTLQDRELVDSFMKLLVRHPAVAPTWALPSLTFIAGVCPAVFLPYVGNPALPDHINAALAGAIIRSGNTEAIKQLDPALTKAFQEAFTLRLSGILPLDSDKGPFFIPDKSSDLIESLEKILEDNKEVSLLSIERANDSSLTIEERLTALSLMRHIEPSSSALALQILASPIEAIRTHMAMRVLMISSTKELSHELEVRAAEILLPQVVRVCGSNNNTIFFERVNPRVWDEVTAAALYAYTPRFCVELLKLANDERCGDRQEILGLLNRKVVSETGYERFIECLAQVQDSADFTETERALASRYCRALGEARQIGIHSPFRFSIELLERIVDDTQLRADDKRPVVVVSFAKADHNQASVFFRRQLEEMSERGFRLLFMEPGDEEELVRQAGSLHSLMTASGIKGASAIFIFGHGSKTKISLSDKSSDELYSIDPSDRGELGAFGALLQPGGVVAHLSCENGRGGKGSGNMVEFHRDEVFPHAGEFKIIAPRSPTSLPGVRVIYSRDGEIIDVIFPVESFKG